MKIEIVTDKAPMPAGSYSQGIKIGNRIYVAGQGPKNAANGEMPETIEEQTRQVLTNIRYILEEGGATLNDVVKVTAHLADMSDFDKYNKVYHEFFKQPFPVRTTVGSVLDHILVEIDVIAEVSSASE
ncbi:RidA family protein [Paenibacillus humicola]|uniref:RidA family protein n=1 Tax=Paenibacillus humicola TaxID=3110540 RepID=UPI00237BF184|nr:Rid family detoxifying hydrolase [Paenibacillus humicola]